MASVVFMYNGVENKINCNINEKIKDIINRYAIQFQINLNNVQFLYGGSQINNFNLTFFEQANHIDKQRNVMNVIVINISSSTLISKGTKKSKEVICPKCKENCLIEIANYKIKLYNCKNGHKIENVLLNEFYNFQNINENEIKCNKCNNTKFKSIDKQFYKCLTCKLNLCQPCSQQHNKEHELIDYNNINYYCLYHKDFYISYCKRCRNNLCMKCEIEHNQSHPIINFKNIFPDEEKIKNDLKIFKQKIDKFKEEIEKFVDKLHDISKNIDIYYKIIYDILYNYKSRQRNYEILTNVNSIKNFIKLNDIDNIINESIQERMKLKNLFDIYDKINNKEEKENIYINSSSHELIPRKDTIFFRNNLNNEIQDPDSINIIFLYRNQQIKINNPRKSFFAEAAFKFVNSVGIYSSENINYLYNGERLKISSPKSLTELNLKDNSIIQVIEINKNNSIINVNFNFEGNTYPLSANIEESFENIALIFSDEIGININELDFFINNNKLKKDNYNKNFKELGLNNCCNFTVHRNISVYI